MCDKDSNVPEPAFSRETSPNQKSLQSTQARKVTREDNIVNIIRESPSKLASSRVGSISQQQRSFSQINLRSLKQNVSIASASKNLPCSNFFQNDENFDFLENAKNENEEHPPLQSSPGAFNKLAEIHEISPLHVSLGKFKEEDQK